MVLLSDFCWAAIESFVCFETSPSSKLFSKADNISAEFRGGEAGAVVPANGAISTFVPLILPFASAKAKFMRVSSEEELTQVSVFMEYPVGGCAP